MKYWSAFTAGLVVLLLLASLTPLRHRGSIEEAPDHAQPIGSIPAATRDLAMQGDAVAHRDEVAQESPSIDLRSASPTFRNSTLVVAIRRAGFQCADVVSSHESADGVWVASCSDMLGYIVTSRPAAPFDVHPVAQYFDSVTPVVLLDRDRPFEPRSPEPQLLK